MLGSAYPLMPFIETKVDLVVITALSEEKKALKDCFGIDFERVSRDGIHYYLGSLNYGDRQINIAAVQPVDMGPVSAAVIAARSIVEWNPSLIVMTGICAGVKGLTRLGDLVVASQVFDHTAGTYREGLIIPFQQSIRQEHWVLQFVQSVLEDEAVFDEIAGCYPMPVKTSVKPDIHVGTMATGSFVVKDSGYVSNLLEKTSKLYGIDMESYGVASAAEICSSALRRVTWLVIKGVVDHADIKKTDNWHPFCAFASAKFLHTLIYQLLSRDASYQWLKRSRE